jgi:methyltransferase (TIGR00027 family)
MRRRRFLQGLVVGGIGALATRPDARAQDATPSRLSEGRPSSTAQGAAQLRATHQLVDQPRVFDDPLALRILGAEAEAAIRAAAGTARTSAMRSLVVVRSRYAEDELARAVQRGIRQYVVLGAGLDTFAYRNPHPASRLRVFEVDHPATQAWKRARLQDVGIGVPESLTFAAIDFEKQTLAAGLRQAGFKPDEPAFFSMLGVVIYLTLDAARETLKFVGSLPSGTEIVFDYATPPSALGEHDRSRHREAARRVAQQGEPWVTYLEPPALAAELRTAGFTRIEDLGRDEVNTRYFQGRTDGMRLSGLAHLAKAGR